MSGVSERWMGCTDFVRSGLWDAEDCCGSCHENEECSMDSKTLDGETLMLCLCVCPHRDEPTDDEIRAALALMPPPVAV